MLLAAQTSAFQTPALRKITQRLQEVGGINLGQGVCNMPVPPELVDAASRAMRDGVNRYTEPRGLPAFRRAIATKLARDNRIDVDPDQQLLATCGATGAFEAVCGVLLNPGDRVIVFEPAYPYHVQALRRCGAEIARIRQTAPTWDIDFDALRAQVSTGAKFVVVNTPGNPTGKVWTESEIELLAECLVGTDTLLVTDEIYEYMVFDGRPHLSCAAHPDLAARTLTIGGFSKTFAITGWRIGFLVSPVSLTEPLARLRDAVYVCPPAPLQQAVAETMETLGKTYFEGLAHVYQAKRDLFSAGLAHIGFRPIPVEGAYYLLAEYADALGEIDSSAAADRLINACGIGAVPSSDFVEFPTDHPWLRFCLAHEDTVLNQALAKMGQLSGGLRA